MAGPWGRPSLDAAGNWMMGFHAWTAPYIDYKVMNDILLARSLHTITFPTAVTP